MCKVWSDFKDSVQHFGVYLISGRERAKKIKHQSLNKEFLGVCSKCFFSSRFLVTSFCFHLKIVHWKKFAEKWRKKTVCFMYHPNCFTVSKVKVLHLIEIEPTIPKIEYHWGKNEPVSVEAFWILTGLIRQRYRVTLKRVNFFLWNVRMRCDIAFGWANAFSVCLGFFCSVRSFIHPISSVIRILFVNEVSQFYGATVVTVVSNIMCHIHIHIHTKWFLDEFPAFAHIVYGIYICKNYLGSWNSTICANIIGAKLHNTGSE